MDLARPPKATPLSRFLSQRLRATWRGVVEFLIALAVFATADPTPVSLAVGGGLALFGELLRIVTAGYGYKVGELSLKGPYRFVRHPYFLGTTLLFTGLAVAGRHPWVTGLALVALTVVLRGEVRRDEEHQARRLGPLFDVYRAQVPAFLPRLFPIKTTPDDARGFSLELAVLKGRHREIDALVGLTLAFALLYALRLMAAKDLFQLAVVITGTVYVLGRILYFAARKDRRVARI